MLALESRGIPTTMVVTSVLAELAKNTAQTYGLPGLRLVTIGESLFGASRARIAELAMPCGERVARALVRNGGDGISESEGG